MICHSVIVEITGRSNESNFCHSDLCCTWEHCQSAIYVTWLVFFERMLYTFLASSVIKLSITFTVVQLLKENACLVMPWKRIKLRTEKDKSSSCELWSAGCCGLPEAWHADMPEKALVLLDSWHVFCTEKLMQGDWAEMQLVTLRCVQLTQWVNSFWLNSKVLLGYVL